MDRLTQVNKEIERLQLEAEELKKKAKKQRTYSFYASMKDIREYGNVKAHF